MPSGTMRNSRRPWPVRGPGWTPGPSVRFGWTLVRAGRRRLRGEQLPHARLGSAHLQTR
ncbi:hypothetical protein ACFFX0_05015 [Citricoccus parietis]|uniref:Uncharacterized protein n=1 Tax=Citricoccus parietis TaxID=592307 RepID=A0ABV5FV67_9MICC